MKTDDLDFLDGFSDVVADRIFRWSTPAALELHTEEPKDFGAQLALARAALVPAPGPTAVTVADVGLERRPPQWRGWSEIPVRVTELMAATADRCLSRSWWQRDKVQVTSVLAVFSSALGPEWKVALRRTNQDRAKAADVERVLRDFEMRAACEYNTQPSSWRAFFVSADATRPRDPAPSAEQLVVEADGYQWWNPREGPCRGCVQAFVHGAKCSLHPIDPEAQ